MRDYMPRGRPEEVSDLEIIRAARRFGEPFGASDLADELGKIGNARARERLNQLEEEGLISKTEIGGSNVYWIDKITKSQT